MIFTESISTMFLAFFWILSAVVIPILLLWVISKISHFDNSDFKTAIIVIVISIVLSFIAELLFPIFLSIVALASPGIAFFLGVAFRTKNIMVYGLPNKRPNGPCKNTLIDLKEFERSIKMFMGA